MMIPFAFFVFCFNIEFIVMLFLSAFVSRLFVGACSTAENVLLFFFPKSFVHDFTSLPCQVKFLDSFPNVCILVERHLVPQFRQ